MVPVTVMGRIYASILMVGGVVIVGAATGTFVSFLQERVQTAHKKSVEEVEPHDGVESQP
jgi:voltage-gated potassium channel